MRLARKVLKNVMGKAILRSLAALLLLFAAMWGQSGNGIVKGTVTDPSGSVVSGASVRLTNRDTNIQRTGNSSVEGLYYFGDIPPGKYTLELEQAGFKRWIGEFEVLVGQTATVDSHLEVGETSATVEVTAAAPVIATEGMQISDVKDSTRIRQLPLNGRNVSNLFNLTPGVEAGAAGTEPRVNGLKVGSTEILQDGVSLVNRFGGGLNLVQPGLDTVQEFRIETNGSSARYSRPATISLVTRSGTNQFHGALFETHRNNAGGLRARRREEGDTPAKLIRNEFGFSAGGPVFIPKIHDGRNKTFWFASYEGLRQREQRNYNDVVPTDAMWNGDFSNIVDNAGVRTHIYDPLTTAADGTRLPFSGDIIPENRLSPIFKTMSTLVHRPTTGTNPYQGTNINTFYPYSIDTNNFTTRIDQRFGDKDSLSGRFTRSSYKEVQAGGRYGAPVEGLADAFGSRDSETTVYSVSLTETHSFTPTLLSELLVSAYRNPNRLGTLADNSPWAKTLGLPNPFGTSGWPTISVDPFYFDNDNRRDQNMTAYNIEENMTWVHGRHSLMFGGKLRREYNNVRELQQSQGAHSFDPDWTALYDTASGAITSYTGNSMATLALGLPTYLSNQYNRGYFYFRQWETGLYVHDTWRATPRLTVDLGVRWDKWTPYQEKYNRLVNVDLDNFANQFQVVTPGSTTMESLPGVPSSVLSSWAARGLSWTTADKAGLPSSLLPADNNNFGPRVGVAYRLGNRMSLRAGYGEYFWTMPLSQILQTSRTNPPLNLRYTNELSNLDGTGTTALRRAPTADQYVGRAAVDSNGTVNINSTAQSFMPWDYRNWKDGHSREWNFTVEAEVLKGTSLRLSYIGSHANGLEQRFSLNGRESEYNYQARTGEVRPAQLDLLRVNKDWNFTPVGKVGFSNTHTAQLELQRRFANGLAFQWYYAFSRSLTTSDASAATSGAGAGVNDTGGVALVPENFQIMGSPNLSFEDRQRLTYYNSTFVPPHRMRWNAIYELPLGRNKRFGKDVSRLTNALIGGWQIATIGEWRSGLYSSVSTSEYLFGDPTLSADERITLNYNGRTQLLYFRGDFDPAQASGVDAAKLQALVPVDRNARVMHPVGSAFDNRIPQRLANGTTRLTSITDMASWNARAFYLGPRAWNFDASLFKWFDISEKARVRVTADFFNVLNHPNDIAPNVTTGLVDLGRQNNDSRVIQLSARFEW